MTTLASRRAFAGDAFWLGLAREAIDLLGLEGLTDGQLSAPLEGRVGGLYRASVGSTISGGSSEILQVVIARRGLGLR